MARYIDADKMLKEYQETLCFNVLCSLCPFLDNIKDDTCQVEKWINEQPTADVKPTVEVIQCKSDAKRLKSQGAIDPLIIEDFERIIKRQKEKKNE